MQRPQPLPVTVGQESVWDYPRPPRMEPDSRRVIVRFNDEVVADSTRTHRVLETSHPPLFYIPPEDVRVELLNANGEQTWCEFKGDAHYYDLAVGDRVSRSAAWCYPEPAKGYEAIQYAIAFYPSRVDECTVDGEIVEAQAGDFYGGWITSEIIGPFKGGPGTQGW
ncbi:MAG TPA: DUF427 domain-containing protein [Thermomicrobiales bacterium]|nr:DUF427 domain-containing protein [Thermomicrobiales bacterium]